MNIRIENLVKKYGSHTVLKNISLEIKDGDLFFLLGPSGCGKTTLLRSIGGFEDIQGGKIYLGDQEISTLPASRRPTAMVFQGYALWPHMTVEENIAFGLQIQKLDSAECTRRVREAMEQMQIAEFAGRRPNELSGGQQQRVALARTLVVHPKCLLLDEPLANLDAKLRRDMRLEIRRICKESGLTGIYVTHDRQEALSMADQIAVMEDGNIRQVGSPVEIYRHPESSFIANFIGETNLLPGIVQSFSNEILTVEASGISFQTSSSRTFRQGQQVLLSIRPEAIFLCKTPGPGPNRFQIRLDQLDYLGEIADHIGHLEDGTVLKFYELNPLLTYRPGDLVTLQAAPEDVTVLQE